jgi:hypothetical protein
MPAGVHILGIRHHGPGSARSVVAALDALQPTAVLIEGPPDADDLIPLAASGEMRPPVALLIYRPDVPKQGVFYPFAEFSPEWQAIRWALSHGVAARFMDLPQRHRLAIEAAEQAEAEAQAANADSFSPEPEEASLAVAPEPIERSDPFALIARASGYTDGERWWEEHFEKRASGSETFHGVLELMTALREGSTSDAHEARREAWMRQTIRETLKEGHERVAVICGAWHAPALENMPTAKSDADVLRGMPKVNVAATWLPWTYRRLTFASGYGAGIHSPGYYEQLWKLRDHGELSTRWMTLVAHLLRSEDLESSTASIIEATRLAQMTATLRGAAVPGLAEFNDAAQAVFCFGSSAPISLIRERLIVGHCLGAVPADAPQVPLQRDFQKETKRLRLPPEALDRGLELDLRKPNDLDRSRLLHRLRLLGVTWGTQTSTRGKGTFKEGWKLRWEPEHEVRLIEHAPWGNTVEEAATRFSVHTAAESSALQELTTLVEILLVAELPGAVQQVMRLLQDRAALTSDVGHLMDALPPLANALRYGNARQTDASMIAKVVAGLVARISVGIHPACAGLNDEAAGELLGRINSTHSAVTLLETSELRQEWTEALRDIADDESLHGLIAGRATRLLLDDAAVDAANAATRLSRELSRANAPAQAAAWIEGFLSGSGLLLLHQAQLWGLLDEWLSGLNPDHFTEILPLLRRTFATFAPPERRQMGELARRGGGAKRAEGPAQDDIDEARAAVMLPTFAMLLGRAPDHTP